MQGIAQKDGKNGGRRFTGAQSVVVAGGRHGNAQQRRVFVHCGDHRRQRQQIGQIAGRVAAPVQQVSSGIGHQRPVIMLAAAVHSGKGLFRQKAHHAVLLRNALHQLHRQLVVVGGNIGGGKKGRQLMLGGRYLVVLGLCHYAQLPQLLVQLLHIGADTGLDGTEVMVVQLLPLGRHRTEEGSSRIAQVTAPLIQLLGDQKIFLLRAYGGGYGGHVLPAHCVQKAHRLAVQSVHTAQQRGFLIQCFAGIAAKGGGDIQAVIFDKSGTGGVPCRIAARLKGGTQSAAGEAAGVGLALYQLAAGEFHDDAAARRGQKAVVLFSGDAGHWLEPVGKVGHAVIQRPRLHHIGDDIGNGGVQRLPAGDDLPQAAVGIVGQALLLHCVVKNKTAEQLRNIAHQNSLPCGEKLMLSPKNMFLILSRCIGEVNVIFR